MLFTFMIITIIIILLLLLPVLPVSLSWDPTNRAGFDPAGVGGLQHP